MMSVKISGLVLQNPVTLADEKYLSLQHAITELIRVVTREGAFSTTNHLLALREDMTDRQKRWDAVNNSKVKGLVNDIEASDCCLILCTKNIGSWMKVQGTMITGTVLATMEFRKIFCTWYDATPP